MARFWNSLTLVMLSVYIGAGLVLAAVAAPTIFAESESRTTAGKIFGIILYRFTIFEVALLIICTAATVTVFVTSRENASTCAAICLGIIIVLFLVNLFYVSPEISRLRDQIRDFDVEPTDQAAKELRAQFGKFHGISSALYLGKLLAAAVAVISLSLRK